MYLTVIRPDIMHGVSLISRFMDYPKEMHLLPAKCIFKYLQGITNYEIMYKREKSELFSFTDSDYTGDPNDRKSTSGYVFMMGPGAISWSSKKQLIVNLSITKVEFVAPSSCAC